MAKQVEAQIHEETKLWSFITLCQSQKRIQGRKSSKKSTIQQFRNLRNRKRKGIAAEQRVDKLQDNFETCEMDNFNLQNFRKLHLNLRNPPVIWDICTPPPFDDYLQIFVCKSLFSPWNPPMTSFLGWEGSRRGE